jgi:hypothetical protein
MVGTNPIERPCPALPPRNCLMPEMVVNTSIVNMITQYQYWRQRYNEIKGILKSVVRFLLVGFCGGMKMNIPSYTRKNNIIIVWLEFG